MLEAWLVKVGLFSQNLLGFNGIHQTRRIRAGFFIVMVISLGLLIIGRGTNINAFLYT